jgi:uncharacterized surface protein with fasciclin (FAS1) repeats
MAEVFKMKKSIMFVFMVVGVMMLATGALAMSEKAKDKRVVENSIVDVAIAVNGEGSPYEGAFDTLIAAVLAADPVVLETLTSRGQYTVFAPTDDAFAALGLDETNIGTAFPQEKLTEILLYHVARGERLAEDVIESSRIRTMSFDFVMQEGGVLTDNLDRESTIIVTDVEANNGVIHAIDSVLLPFAP